MDAIATPDPSTVWGGMADVRRRELPDGSVIEFCSAPAGWLAQNGEPRVQEYRAYHHTAPERECDFCKGTGRVEGKTPRGRKCSICNGEGRLALRRRMVSVSTIRDSILPKDGLTYWAEQHGILGADEAWRRGDLTAAELDPVAVVRALKLGMAAARERAADRGLNVHDLLEVYGLTGVPPALRDHPVEHHGYITALCRWLLRDRPEPEAIEQLVCSPADGYAGRLDLIAAIAGTRTLVDVKTSERAGAYDSGHLQLGLLRRGIVACGDAAPEHCKLVVLAADGAVREMDCLVDEQAVDAALEWYRRISPVQAACASANRVEREARRAA